MAQITYADKATGDTFAATEATLIKTVVNANDTSTAAHIANAANPHGTTKAQVGLGNVDNTADTAKPVSTAQAAADATKQPILQAITAPITAATLTLSQANNFWLIDTTSNAVAITLPPSPVDNDELEFKIVTLGAFNATIICNTGQLFNKTGGATVFTMILLNEVVRLKYKAGIWIVANSNALSQLDGRYVNIVVPTPTNGTDAVNKNYSDANAGIPLQIETAAYVNKLNAAGSLISGSLINAIDAFFVNGKVNGWLTKLVWCWAPMGSNLTGALVNLYAKAGIPASVVNNNFVAADYDQQLGFGTGSVVNTTKYLSAGFQPATFGINTNNISAGMYSNNADASNGNEPLVGMDSPAASGRSSFYIVRSYSPTGQFQLAVGNTGGQPYDAHFYSACGPVALCLTVTGNQSYKETKNGLLLADATLGLPIANIALNADLNLFRTMWFSSYVFSAGKMNLAFLATPLSGTESAALTGAINKLMVATGASYASGGNAIMDGDSITEGLGATTNILRGSSQLCTSLGFNETNIGAQGAQLRQTATAGGGTNGVIGGYLKDPFIVKLDYNFIRFLWGTNDAYAGDGTSTGDPTVIADFKAKYNAKVVIHKAIKKRCLITSPPWSSAINLTKLVKYVDAAADVAFTNDVPFVDFYNLIADLPTPSSAMFDSLHPNPVGYKLCKDLEASVLNSKRTYRTPLVDYSATAIAAGASADLTFIIYNATDMMPVFVKPSAPISGISLNAWVSTAAVAGTPAAIITLRATNTSASSITIAAQRMKIEVLLDA